MQIKGVALNYWYIFALTTIPKLTQLPPPLFEGTNCAFTLTSSLSVVKFSNVGSALDFIMIFYLEVSCVEVKANERQCDSLVSNVDT